MSALRNLEPWSFSLVLTTHKGVVTSTFTTPRDKTTTKANTDCGKRHTIYTLRTLHSLSLVTNGKVVLETKMHKRKVIGRIRGHPAQSWRKVCGPKSEIRWTFLSWVTETRLLWSGPSYLQRCLWLSQCWVLTAFPSASWPWDCGSSRSRQSWNSTGCRWPGTNLCTELVCREGAANTGTHLSSSTVAV